MIGRAAFKEVWEDQVVIVNAVAGGIVPEETIEDTYLNHLKSIKVTLEVVNLNFPRPTTKPGQPDHTHRDITMKGESLTTGGVHRASGSFSSGQFWSMETFIILSHQKDLRINIEDDIVVSKWLIEIHYLSRIRDRIIDWCAARIGHAITKLEHEFTGER